MLKCLASLSGSFKGALTDRHLSPFVLERLDVLKGRGSRRPGLSDRRRPTRGVKGKGIIIFEFGRRGAPGGSGASGNRALVVQRAFESALRGGGRNGFLGRRSVRRASITGARAPSAGSGLEARPSRPNFINFAGQKASPGRSKRPSAFGSGPLLKHTSRTRRSVLGCPNALPGRARRLAAPARRRWMRWGVSSDWWRRQNDP